MSDPDHPQAWSPVAGAWDRHIDALDRWRKPATDALIDYLAVRSGERVLELAAGPGTLGAQWSSLVGPAGTVVLSDLAPAMVDVARTRNASLANVSVEVLDATAIARPDESFDVVACQMGLMLVPTPHDAFAEIRRVLAPAGRFAALVWAAAEENPWLSCIGMAAAVSGIRVDGSPVGPGGVFSLADRQRLAALAADAGFAGVTVRAIDLVFRASDPGSHVERVTAVTGPIAAGLAMATTEQVAEYTRVATETIAGFAGPDGVAVPGRALLVAGTA